MSKITFISLLIVLLSSTGCYTIKLSSNNGTVVKLSEIKAVDDGLGQTKMLISIDQDYYAEDLNRDIPLRMSLKKGEYPVFLNKSGTPLIDRIKEMDIIAITLESVDGESPGEQLFIDFPDRRMAKTAYEALLNRYVNLPKSRTILLEVKKCKYSIIKGSERSHFICNITDLNLE